MNTVKIRIQFNAREIVIPVNPEDMVIDRKASNDNIDILGLGKATRKGEVELITTKIESFFPSPLSEFYTGTPPQVYAEFIDEIWHTENTNNNVAKIITEGLPVNLNMYFVIENFSFSGDSDIDYTLSIKQYIPYGVKVVDASLVGMANARAMSVTAAEVQSTPNTVTSSSKTYTVQSGDSLFAITKRCTGNGSQWNALYELNKDKIKNPSLIYPGQALVLPTDWNAPITSKPVVSATPKNTVSQEVLDRHKATYNSHIGAVNPRANTQHAQLGQSYYWRTHRRGTSGGGAGSSF